jgi:GNAT superfamily N-acetyltransferase
MVNILGFVVKGKCRNQGVGKLLGQSLEQWAKENGHTGIRLDSGFSRSAAHRFYESQGYTHVKDHKCFRKMFKSI